LVASLAGVGLKIYWEWQKGPWSLPGPVKARPAADRGDEKARTEGAQPIAGTDTIIARNLFDPERGAGRTKETEADTRAVQRIRSMILLGTAILGSNRYAIVQEADGAGRAPVAVQAAAQGPRRIKVGDSIDGFNLAEVREKTVVFARGPTRVELSIDYFRKVPVAAVPTPIQPGQPRAPGQPPPGRVAGQGAPGAPSGQPAPGAVPGVIPALPRRPRLPVSPAQ
jgi:hypothetical protein